MVFLIYSFTLLRSFMKHFLHLFLALFLSSSCAYSSASILGDMEFEQAFNTSFNITSSNQPQTSPDTILNDSIGYEKKETSPINQTPHFLERSFSSIRVVVTAQYLEQCDSSKAYKQQSQTSDFGTPWEDDNETQVPITPQAIMRTGKKISPKKTVMTFDEKFKDEIARQKKS